MSDFSVRQKALALVLLGGAVLSTACEDKRVKELDVGMRRDSAISIMSEGASGKSGPDSMPNVYSVSRFLISGKQYEVMYFTPNDAKKGKDSVTLKDLTPVVMVDSRVIGKGWPFWDSVSTANKIPVQQR